MLEKSLQIKLNKEQIKEAISEYVQKHEKEQVLEVKMAGGENRYSDIEAVVFCEPHPRYRRAPKAQPVEVSCGQEDCCGSCDELDGEEVE